MAPTSATDPMATHRDTFPPIDDATNDRRLSDMTPDERSATVRAIARRIADERSELLDRLSRR